MSISQNVDKSETEITETEIPTSPHISLDDPLIIHFSGDSVQKLFKRLGASVETGLSNPLITTAIRRAQKIEGQAPRDLPASSPDDWFKFQNCVNTRWRNSRQPGRVWDAIDSVVW
jgi:hypothetical protein